MKLYGAKIKTWKIISRFYLDASDKCRLSLNQSFEQDVDFFLEINGEIFNDLQQINGNG